jgi:uncharacterized protein (TIGR01732 family)
VKLLTSLIFDSYIINDMKGGKIMYGQYYGGYGCGTNYGSYGCGTGTGTGSSYALILVLFILLVIIGSAWSFR